MKNYELKMAKNICIRELGLFEEGKNSYYPVKPISDLTQGRVVPWLGDIRIQTDKPHAGVKIYVGINYVVRGGGLVVYTGLVNGTKKLIIEYGVLKKWGAYYHNAPEYTGNVCVLNIDEPRAQSVIKNYIGKIYGLEKREIKQHTYTPDYLVERINELGDLNGVNPFEGGMVTEEIARRDAEYYYPWLSLIEALELRPE